MTKTDALRGRFEEFMRKRWPECSLDWYEPQNRYYFGTRTQTAWEAYQAAQPTEAEIEELERKWAQAIEGILLRRIYEKRVEGYTLETGQEMAAAVASLLRGKLGGTGR